MTNLTEQSLWEAGVFQLETDTPVLGGPPGFDAGVPVTGHSNAQAQQLANRTTYLNEYGVKEQGSKTYTLLTLPTAAGKAGGLIWVSDLTAGAFFCYSDGTDWRRLDDKTIAS
jgi:hypothetical protein